MGLPLSGFTAIPNPYMIPFMGYQSWVIGSMFGMAYQGYKRKISAMSNEEFNKIDITQFGFDEMRKMTAMTPQMEQMFAEMRPMLTIMAKELGELFRSIPDYISNVVTGSDSGALKGFGGSPLPQLINPAGINANMELWASQGLITQETLETFRKQATSALEKARIANQEGVGKVLQLSKANRLAQEAREGRSRDAIAQRKLDATEKERLLTIQRERQPIVNVKQKAGRSQIAERNRLIKAIASSARTLSRSTSGGQTKAYTAIQIRDQIKLENLLNRYRF